MMVLRILGASAAVMAAAFAGSALATAEDAVSAGRAIYRDGQLPGGAPLRARGASGMELSGASAACVQCHRGSGLGQVEGDVAVPPVTGRALFGATRSVVVTADRVRGKEMNQSHEPYGDEDFRRLVRDGRRPGGQALAAEMPRYALDDGALGALRAYLETLSVAPDPGVQAGAIRFATVIAPGVDPARRRAFLDTLQAAVRAKNANTMPGKRHMVSAAEFAMVTERRWTLSVWQLEGPEDGWGAQLDGFLRREPVFALLSGLSDGGWAPVHHFCEERRVPCWFPSVPVVPAEAGRGGHAIYFQRGVALEAELIAERLAGLPAGRKLLQVTDGSVAAEQGARRLADLRGAAAAGEVRVLRDLAPETLAAAARAAAGADDLVLWLHGQALAAFAGAASPGKAQVYLSGRLSGIDQVALPAGWRNASVAYLYELPGRRGPNTAYFRAWLAQARVPLTDEALQNEAYFAVTYLSDTLAEMLGNLHRDYLLERAESMLGRREARRAEDEARDAQGLRRYASAHPLSPYGTQGRTIGARDGTTIYPQLALGPGQRFASKGGYVLPVGALASPDAGAEWIIPTASATHPH